MENKKLNFKTEKELQEAIKGKSNIVPKLNW